VTTPVSYRYKQQLGATTLLRGPSNARLRVIDIAAPGCAAE
jgi:hypothetical protein